MECPHCSHIIVRDSLMNDDWEPYYKLMCPRCHVELMSVHTNFVDGWESMKDFLLKEEE
jgi:hypothetical protein